MIDLSSTEVPEKNGGARFNMWCPKKTMELHRADTGSISEPMDKDVSTTHLVPKGQLVGNMPPRGKHDKESLVPKGQLVGNMGIRRGISKHIDVME